MESIKRRRARLEAKSREHRMEIERLAGELQSELSPSRQISKHPVAATCGALLVGCAMATRGRGRRVVEPERGRERAGGMVGGWLRSAISNAFKNVIGAQIALFLNSLLEGFDPRISELARMARHGRGRGRSRPDE
ncbi:MAG TPA: hypothetical protein PL033_04765 [Candidatus Brocadiia bacterium]|nr:hypothetical protein [Candidatus Brocadiia bacterium]